MKSSIPIALGAVAAIALAGLVLFSVLSRDGETAADQALDGVRAESLQTDDESAVNEDQRQTELTIETDQGSQGTSAISRPTTTIGADDPTTSQRLTTDTVEADSVDPESELTETSVPEESSNTSSTDDINSSDENDDPDPNNTAPTVPPNTDGTCRLVMSDLDGQSGVVDLASVGTCAAVGVTIQSVNPRDDLADVRWGRDIEICRRHPAAEAIDVAAVTAGGSDDLADGMSRNPDQDPAIDAIVITFADLISPITGPRPIATCRTSAAELSIVHQPVG